MEPLHLLKWEDFYTLITFFWWYLHTFTEVTFSMQDFYCNKVFLQCGNNTFTVIEYIYSVALVLLLQYMIWILLPALLTTIKADIVLTLVDDRGWLPFSLLWVEDYRIWDSFLGNISSWIKSSAILWVRKKSLENFSDTKSSLCWR